MIDVFVAVAVFAAESPGPRGDNPDGSGGILMAPEGRVGRVSEFQDR